MRRPKSQQIVVVSLVLFGSFILFDVSRRTFAEPAGGGAGNSTDAKTGGNSQANNPKPRTALILAFDTNLDYCKAWLKAKDAKSLAQGTGALSVLTEAINRHTAESGKDKIDALKKTVTELSDAAKADDAKHAEQALAAMPALLDAVAATSLAESPIAAKKTTAGFTPLMHLIDGTYTDAKTSLATGDASVAKTYSVAIADLSQWLAADRGGEQWHTQADDLSTAAQAVATSNSSDAKVLRAALHDVYTRCEACHHRNR